MKMETIYPTETNLGPNDFADNQTYMDYIHTVVVPALFAVYTHETRDPNTHIDGDETTSHVGE